MAGDHRDVGRSARAAGRRIAIAAVAVLAAACSSQPTGHATDRPRVTFRTTTTTLPPTTTSTSSATTTTELPPTTKPSPTTTSTVPPVPVAGSLTRFFGTVWRQIPTTSQVVALTFDAGANGNGVPSITSTLRTDGVPATFFLTGSFTTSFPALARTITGSGDRVGDHTVDHPHLTTLSDTGVVSEVTDAARTIQTVTGASPLPFFRFPYGEGDGRTLKIVNDLGYVAVGWTVDTLGWEGTSAGITAASIVARVMAALRPGEIILMHVGSNAQDGSTLDADALGSVISAVRAAGYSFVTMDALLETH